MFAGFIRMTWSTKGNIPHGRQEEDKVEGKISSTKENKAGITLMGAEERPILLTDSPSGTSTEYLMCEV